MFVSMDGYAAGDEITFEKPIGDATALFAGFDGRFIHGFGPVDAPFTLDRALTSTWGQGIGAEIMGRGKFGPQTGPWPEDGWRGWWGDEPPFRTPVFVLTHHEHAPIAFENGTVFHFLDASPAEALAVARDAAGGQDVRIGGGPSTVRAFLEADLVDVLHLVTVPVVLGRGTPLWQGLGGVHDRFDVESLPGADGVTHHIWNRRARQEG